MSIFSVLDESDFGLIDLYFCIDYMYASISENAFVVTYCTLSLMHSVIIYKTVLCDGVSLSFYRTGSKCSITRVMPFSRLAQALAKT